MDKIEKQSSANKLTKEQRSELVQKYQTGRYTVADLGREYGISRPGASWLIKSRGINIVRPDQHIYTINSNYFNKIDTENKAYFLGLLAADGCIHSKKGILTIGLQEKDRHILELFLKDMDSSYPILLINFQKYNWQSACRISIRDNKIWSRLIELGLLPNKTYNLKFPTSTIVDTSLFQHYLRGFLDGDGSIYFYYRPIDNMVMGVSFSNTLSFCRSLHRWLLERNWYNTFTVINGLNGHKHARINITRQKDIVSFLEWLYKDANTFLIRKHQKFMEMKEFYYRKNLEKITFPTTE